MELIKGRHDKVRAVKLLIGTNGTRIDRPINLLSTGMRYWHSHSEILFSSECDIGEQNKQNNVTDETKGNAGDLRRQLNT